MGPSGVFLAEPWLNSKAHWMFVRRTDNTEEAHICVYQAGFVGESLVRGERVPGLVPCHGRRMRSKRTPIAVRTDVTKALDYLRQGGRPLEILDDATVIERFRRHEQATRAILRKELVWSAVMRVAEALLVKRRLYHEDAVELVGRLLLTCSEIRYSLRSGVGEQTTYSVNRLGPRRMFFTSP